MARPDGIKVGSTYEIHFQGRLEGEWTTWLGGLLHTTEVSSGDSQVTCLTIGVSDQAALRGMVNRLWDLNLTLICVRLIESDSVEETDHDC